MATEIKPLFRPDAIRPKRTSFLLPDRCESASQKLTNWANLLGSKQAETMKETELLADFIRDVFVDLLGYVPPPATPYTLKREALVKVDGKFADAGFGVFDGNHNTFVAVLEGKGPRDPLDRPFAGRKRSAVEQALQYAVQLQLDWYLVTNLKEIRLYHKGHDTFTYERFETARLAEDGVERRRFVYLLGAERMLQPGGNHLDILLAESKRIGRELTNSYYREYRALRERVFETLREHNPDETPIDLLAATQKMLDRVLFIAFCEDRGLLPGDIIARAYEHADPFNPRPIWHNFVGLFRAVDAGNELLNITRYNGGLFAADSYLEKLTVPDAVCEGFKKLAEYEYGNDPDADARLIDVEILGHIFEQSISDLEEMQERIAGRVATTKAKEQKKNTRKESGAFYTPAFITRYIVAQTLGPIVAARFEQCRAAHEAAAAKTIKKVLADPAVFDPAKLTKPQHTALVSFWHDWIDDLQTVRLVDPACGSGAFLIEAFDQLFAEYQKAQGFLEELRGKTLFDIRKTILEHNLYGVDL
ncbi:MAG: Eco57I restriction-modification methylase domain-containing protein, partial [Gemmataceae bacterium]